MTEPSPGGPSGPGTGSRADGAVDGAPRGSGGRRRVAPELRSRPNWAWRDSPVEAPGEAVIFDVDGVLSDAVGRQHFIERGRRDWDRFFEACGDDPVIAELATLVDLLDRRLHVILLTGRPLRVQPQTLAWLERYRLRWDLLVMRNRGDYSQVSSFKRDAVEDLRTYGFDLKLAFEDDPANFAMFHGEGVPCVYIHSGYYE